MISVLFDARYTWLLSVIELALNIYQQHSSGSHNNQANVICLLALSLCREDGEHCCENRTAGTWKTQKK